MSAPTKLERQITGLKGMIASLHGEVVSLERSYAQVLGALERLEGVVSTDELTGLLRRNSFFRKWQEILNECRDVENNCGLLLLDIDHFKKINDTHGHPTGDEVLRKVAALLKGYESERLIVGRLGGEEFIVGLRGTDAEILGAAEFIRRGVERLHGPVVRSDGSPDPAIAWRCTISIGVASAESHGFETQKLLGAADEALYVAKAKGRNQVRSAA